MWIKDERYGFTPGEKVKITRCKDMPELVGKTAIVCGFQDCQYKIKVSFSEQWQGYFTPTQLMKL